MLIDHLNAKFRFYFSEVSVEKLIVCFVIVLSILLVISRKRAENWLKLRFWLMVLLESIYFTGVCSATLLGRTPGVVNTSYSVWHVFITIRNGGFPDIYDLLFNVLMFIPAGIILSYKYRSKYALVMPFVISLFIESIQYIFSLGMFQIEDIVLNTVGGQMGALIHAMVKKVLGIKGARKLKR